MRLQRPRPEDSRAPFCEPRALWPHQKEYLVYILSRSRQGTPSILNCHSRTLSRSDNPSRNAKPSYVTVNRRFPEAPNILALVTVRPLLLLVTIPKSATIAASVRLLEAVPTSLLNRATTPNFTCVGSGTFSGLERGREVLGVSTISLFLREPQRAGELPHRHNEHRGIRQLLVQNIQEMESFFR